MLDQAIILWDLDDDAQGNVVHVAEHGISKEEVEAVIRQTTSSHDVSRRSGDSLIFGWTTTGKHIVVIYQVADHDPLQVYPITAYETEPPRRRR